MNRALRNTQRSFEKDREKLRKKKARSEEFLSLDSEEWFQVQDIEKAIDFTISQRLSHEARALDIEQPPYYDKTMWVDDRDVGKVWLSGKGRAYLRAQIHEQKAKHFESNTLWVTRFWLPLITSLIGVIGALTGLIAVFHKK